MNPAITHQAAPAPARIAPRPLMPIAAVGWRLDLEEKQVMELIHKGQLLWAWNIAGPDAYRRTDPRILTESVAKYLEGQRPAQGEEFKSQAARQFEAETEWQRIASLIFPSEPEIVTCELARCSNCSRDHVVRLLRAGQFQQVPETRIHRGVTGQARIETASAVEWLKGRRL